MVPESPKAKMAETRLVNGRLGDDNNLCHVGMGMVFNAHTRGGSPNIFKIVFDRFLRLSLQREWADWG